MSTKSTSKKNGNTVNVSSPQQAREEDILLTQVHKLHDDIRPGTRNESRKLQEEDESRPAERPSGKLNPDEPSDSLREDRSSDSDDRVSSLFSGSEDFFGSMMSSQVSIMLTGAQVTLDESANLQNAATSPVVGDSNDNDIAANNLPADLASRLSVLVSESPIEAARSGYDGVTGQPLVEINADASVQSMAFTNAAGQALNGEDSGLLTLTGQHIFLFSDTQDPHLVLGKTSAGQVVMAVYLSPTGPDLHAADVWTVLYQPLQHPDSSAPDEAVNLAGKLFVTAETTGGSNVLVAGPSGQNLFLMLGNHDEAVVVTGVHPANQSQGINFNKGDTVNSSQALGHLSIGTNNQMVDGPSHNQSGLKAQTGEGLVITYVTGANPNYTSPQLSPTEADVEANIQFEGLKESTHAIFGVNQLQPVKAATLKITALQTGYEPGVQFVDGLLSNDTPVGITRVVVMDSHHNVLEDSNGSVNSPSISISFSGGTATVTGIVAGNLIAFDTVNNHNRVLIENPGNANPYLSSSFDLGYFSWGESESSTLDIGAAVRFEDSAPSASENLVVQLDDDALAGGNVNGVGDISPDTQNATGTLGHSYGAEGGSMAWLSSGAPEGFTYVVEGNQLLIEQGEITVMTLTLDTTTGAYTVEQNAPLMHPEGLNENNQNFNVTYQVTDSDGDTAAGQLAITVNDDTPTVSENLMVVLDDDALPNGIPGGVNDLSPDTQNATGTLGHSYGADGGSMAWLSSGAPEGFTYVVEGNQLLIEQGETTVMTLTLNSTTGAYTVEQNAPLMHPEGLNENNQNFNVTYQVTDGDGDTAAGQLAITVNDDTPTVSENLMVIFDDDALAGGNPGGVNDLTPDTQNATGTLGHSYGADGGSMAWLSSGAPEGFTYVVEGNQLLIEQGETTVMTLTLNSTTGAYTVEQNAPLMHPEGLNENNQNFNVTYQVTDGDGDTAAGQLAITVNDDTPTVSENLMVIFDDDALAGGNPGGVNDLTPDTQNATGTLGHSYGADGGSMAWLSSGAPEGFTYVVEGNQLLIEQGETTVMTLTLNSTTGAYTVEQNAPLMHPEGLNENNQNFNVTYQVTDGDGDTAAGQLAITVNDDTPTVSENLMVIFDDDALAGGNPGGVNDLTPDTQNATGTLGHSYGADGGSMAWLSSGAPEGFTYVVEGNQLLIEQGETTVMTLTLDSTTGAYTVEQNAPLMHPEGLNENNQNFNVTYQVTDGDGDTAAGQLAITVNDDTPTVSENLMVIFDDDALAGGNPGGVNDLTPDTQNATGTLGHSYGADGGSMAWLSSGAPEGFTYVVEGNQLLIEQGETTVMTLTLDSTTGAYTVEQNAPLMHPEGLNENNQNFNVTYQVTDSDGDTAAGELAITVNDDTPTVSENLMVIFDDDALAGGNPGGVNDLTPDTQNATGTLGHSYGADGGSMAWLSSGAPEGFTYVVEGNQLLIEQGETTVMTLTLNSTTGAYTVEQNAPLMHPEGLNENNQNFNVTYQVTDGDGDTAAGQLAITVNDDTPTVSENLMVIFDDDALAGGNPGGVNDLTPDTQNATGTLGHSYGADGGSMAWLSSGAPEGFTYVVEGNQLLIEQGETTVMTLTLNSTTGAYTVEQNAPLMHPEGLNENNQNFNVAYQVTDGDGDTAAGQLAITVNDDTPTVSENLVIHLDDNALPGGNPVGNEGIPPDIQNTSGTLAHSYGADGGAVAWLTDGAPEGFSYQTDGTSLLILQGDVTIITLSLDTATGEYLAVQNAAVINAAIPGENSQDFQVGYSVTDGDGDSTNGLLAITVKDDTPHGSFNEINLLDDDALLGGNPGGIGDVAPDTAFATGNLDFAFGADGGSIAWLTTDAPDGFTYEAEGTSLLVKQGGTLVLTLTLDPVSAAYTVVQSAAIQHAAGLDENSQAFTMNYIVLDNDSDSAIGQFYITVNDDSPVAGENLVVHLDDDALPGGNPVGNEGLPPDIQNTSGTLVHSYGADGGSMVWLTTGAPEGFTYQADGTSLLIRQGEVTVITLTLDTATGEYLAVQNAPVVNQPGLGENNQDFQVGYRVTDGDGDSTTGLLAITVNDDEPHGSFNEINRLDDDALLGGNPGGIGDVAPDTAFATGNLDFAFGADGGSIAWLTTGAPDGFTYEAEGTSLLVKQGGTLVLTLTLDPVSAAYTVVQNAAILHASGLDENSQAFTMNYNVLDNDGDPAIGQFYIVINDDTPVVTQLNDVWFQNTDNPVPGGDSQFAYAIGADKRSSFSNVDSDFSMFSLKGEVGVNSITNTHITWNSEDTTSAIFRFDFDYQPNEASPSTAHAMGTLMFDKAEGTYHINLDQYIQGFNILTTSAALSITGYEPNSTTVDKTQPAVSVAELSDGAYVQFTSVSEPGGGTGSNNLTVNGVDADINHWAAGELFSQSIGWVSISNLSNGVNGDTMQKGEVLNLSLFDFNPYGNLSASPNAGASGMFLKFDGISSEDLVVVLKLVDTETLQHTTRALIVDKSDILKLGNVLTPDYHIVLDNNDGAVIIETNDFNGVGEHFVMTGAQILTSTEGITGTALNFNTQTGATGASTTAQSFGTATTDNDVIKISDIGLMTNQTSTLDSHLEFKFAVKDADLDASPTQTLNAYIAGSDVNPLESLM